MDALTGPSALNSLTNGSVQVLGKALDQQETVAKKILQPVAETPPPAALGNRLLAVA